LKESLAIGKAIEDPRIISFCERKLKELEEPENIESSNKPSVSRNFFVTIQPTQNQLIDIDFDITDKCD